MTRKTTRATTACGSLPAVIFLAALTATCASGGTTSAKYPRRGSGCAIAVIHQPTPPVPEWDDLGVVEAGCYLDEGPAICLQRLKAEGCRMGGDMIYDVPRKPARPTERALVYRGNVAHTKTTVKAAAEEPSDAGSGPVIPIGSEAPVATPSTDASPASPGMTDAGVAGDAAVSTL